MIALFLLLAVCFLINAASEGTLGTITAGVLSLFCRLGVLAVIVLMLSAIAGGSP